MYISLKFYSNDDSNLDIQKGGFSWPSKKPISFNVGDILLVTMSNKGNTFTTGDGHTHPEPNDLIAGKVLTVDGSSLLLVDHVQYTTSHAMLLPGLNKSNYQSYQSVTGVKAKNTDDVYRASYEGKSVASLDEKDVAEIGHIPKSFGIGRIGFGGNDTDTVEFPEFVELETEEQ